jgi:hypothetical protein
VDADQAEAMTAASANAPPASPIPSMRRLDRRICIRLELRAGSAFAAEDKMAKREEFLELLWKDVIDEPARMQALDNIILNCRRDPDGPFSDAGPAIERLLALGASRRDLCLLFRSVAYEAVFGTLYSLNNPGLAPHDDPATLYEDLLGSDPTGMEGRPGSIDLV